FCSRRTAACPWRASRARMSRRVPPWEVARRIRSRKASPLSILMSCLLLPFASTANQLSTWSSQTSGATNDFYAVAHANNTFVAVGAGGMLYSSDDGRIWTPRTSGTTNDLQGIVFGDGRFVAVGRNGSIRTSTNGTNWVGYLSGFNSAFQAVTYG